MRDVKERGREEVLIKCRMLRDVERKGGGEDVKKGREREVGMWRKGCSKLER